MYAIYSLTCANDEEAVKIAKHLISQHLVVCTKRIKVSSVYPWKGKIEEAEEILLIMDGKAKDFEMVEKEIRSIHSYEQFVLTYSPISHINKGAQDWMEKELK